MFGFTEEVGGGGGATSKKRPLLESRIFA